MGPRANALLAWRAAALTGLLVMVAVTAPTLAGADARPGVSQHLLTALCLLAAAGAVVQAMRGRGALRIALAAGVSLWALGSVWFTTAALHLDIDTYPSVADLLWLATYPALYVAVMLVIRDRVARWDAGVWLDGVIAAVSTAALGTALVLPVLDAGKVDSLTVVVNFAYPLADLVLLGIVAGGWVMTRGGRAGVWRWLAAALVVLGLSDLSYAVSVAAGTYEIGGLTDVGWPLAFLLLANALFVRADARPPRALRARVPVTPLLGSGVGVVLLLVNDVADVSHAAVWLATTAIVLGIVRTALALWHNVRLQDSAHQAVTDELTGLGNRRRLLADLEEVLAGGRPTTLALFDLDGFKAYNDTYGHPAGDALLAGLGARLHRSVQAHGRAYRLGGDEFCVLVEGDAVDHSLVLDAALEALRQDGPGFAIAASHGSVELPAEARRPVEALQAADTRMYVRKDARRASNRHQSRDLLLRLLHEQQPDLEVHSGDVGALVAAVGRRLGLGEADVDHAQLAAELHDVGKVAIPASVLEKPGPLDDEEWALMRRHTVVGERILAAVPALVPVGRIVRSTHERWDGGGYPDGLRGDEIPLAARIVAVCDSFDAITTDRPYRAGRTTGEALAELRRCSGTQFDPAVVDAFVAELGAGDASAGVRGAALAAAGRAVSVALPEEGVLAQAAADELAVLARLRGLLHASRLGRAGAGSEAVLTTICRTIAGSLGFRTVVVNLAVPAGDELVCVAVEGSQEARRRLLGRSRSVASWDPLLDARFDRGGAFFVPAGAVDFDDEDVAWHVPDLVGSDDPGAWQADDVLVVPLRSTAGELLGVISVDEPVWGRRPSDVDLDVLVAVCGHAALAVEHERADAAEAAWRRAEARIGRLAHDLAAAADRVEVVAALEACLQEALGLPDAEVVVGPPEDDDGAWHDGLAVPVRGPEHEVLAVAWLGRPGPGALPEPALARALEAIAGQAALALSWAGREPGVPAMAAGPRVVDAA